MRILQKLEGTQWGATQWGAKQKTLQQVYIGSVTPVLEYAFLTFGIVVFTTLHKLQKIQTLVSES